MNYVWAFVVGGAICVIGQLFIDYTKLTPARILTGYVVAGVVLSAVGVYKPLAEFAGAGASVPLLGFGHLLAQGVVQAVDRCGLPGAFTGGLTAAAGGIAASLIFAVAAALVGKSRDQNSGNTAQFPPYRLKHRFGGSPRQEPPQSGGCAPKRLAAARCAARHQRCQNAR